MNPHYNQNYSREQIDAILEKIKDCVINNKYTMLWVSKVTPFENLDTMQ